MQARYAWRHDHAQQVADASCNEQADVRHAYKQIYRSAVQGSADLL